MATLLALMLTLTTGCEPVSREPKPAPLTSFGDGTYVVGNGAGNVKRGTYRMTVPAGMTFCYWQRSADLSGSARSVIQSGRPAPGETVTVTIGQKDREFAANGCGEWRMV